MGFFFVGGVYGAKNGAANGSANGHAANGARDGFGILLARERGADEVDLLVRTGGERRLSDFLLWESAYAELVFSRRMWPDFDGRALRRAVEADNPFLVPGIVVRGGIHQVALQRWSAGRWRVFPPPLAP